MVLQPEIWYHIAGIFILTAVFYLLIPGLGAFHIRASWRRFRALLLESKSCPHLSYPTLRQLSDEQTSGGIGQAAGGCSEDTDGCSFHFYGSLQAMQGDTEIWLTDGHVTVRADLKKVFVYMLPPVSMPEEDTGDHYPTDTPRRVRWEQISSLPEHTRIFISGRLFFSEGQFVFRDSADHPLLAVIYEGEEKGLLVRATWSGRQKNEYWNAYTPGSISLGSFALFGYSYILFRNAHFLFPAVLSVIFALLPISVFFPPGVIFYYFYRRFWKHGRVLRARRDLIRLSVVDEACRAFIESTRGYPQDCSSPGTPAPERAKICERRAFFFEGLAVIIFSLGIVLTALLIFLFFSYLIL